MVNSPGETSSFSLPHQPLPDPTKTAFNNNFRLAEQFSNFCLKISSPRKKQKIAFCHTGLKQKELSCKSCKATISFSSYCCLVTNIDNLPCQLCARDSKRKRGRKLISDHQQPEGEALECDPLVLVHMYFQFARKSGPSIFGHILTLFFAKRAKVKRTVELPNSPAEAEAG